MTAFTKRAQLSDVPLFRHISHRWKLINHIHVPSFFFLYIYFHEIVVPNRDYIYMPNIFFMSSRLLCVQDPWPKFTTVEWVTHCVFGTHRCLICSFEYTQITQIIYHSLFFDRNSENFLLNFRCFFYQIPKYELAYVGLCVNSNYVQYLNLNIMHI